MDPIGRLAEDMVASKSSLLGDRRLALVLGFSLTGLVALGDALTGALLPLGLVYVVPVALVAWAVGPRAGLLLALLSAFVPLGEGLLRPSIALPAWWLPLLPYWNAGLRLGIFALVISLIMQVRQAHTREQALARQDPLTEVSNARAFAEAATRELQRADRSHQPVSVAYIDLDNFKAVNDRLGHQAGDQLLRAVGQTLVSATRAMDLTARLGGDEFVILLPDTGAEAAQAVVRRVQAQLAAATQQQGWPLTVSVGLTTWLRPPQSVADLLHTSDGLLYAAKQEGKNGLRQAVVGAR
jgi:diguanylate cyclase (GGDEF)-like protein